MSNPKILVSVNSDSAGNEVMRGLLSSMGFTDFQHGHGRHWAKCPELGLMVEFSTGRARGDYRSTEPTQINVAVDSLVGFNEVKLIVRINKDRKVDLMSIKDRILKAKAKIEEAKATKERDELARQQRAKQREEIAQQLTALGLLYGPGLPKSAEVPNLSIRTETTSWGTVAMTLTGSVEDVKAVMRLLRISNRDAAIKA